MVDTCCCCGKIVPEGRYVCYICEKTHYKNTHECKYYENDKCALTSNVCSEYGCGFKTVD